MSKWVLDTCQGVKTWYSSDVIEKIKKIVEQLYYKDLIENKKSLDEILDELHEILELIENGDKSEVSDEQK